MSAMCQCGDRKWESCPGFASSGCGWANAERLRSTSGASPDQVWDWAGRLSDHAQRLHRARELWAAIQEGETTCGSCTKWMTDACPRERRDQRGSKVGGPSCKAFKCGEFVMSQYEAKRIAGLRDEYATTAGAGKDQP